jgi:hypothetical protein
MTHIQLQMILHATNTTIIQILILASCIDFPMYIIFNTCDSCRFKHKYFFLKTSSTRLNRWFLCSSGEETIFQVNLENNTSNSCIKRASIQLRLRRSQDCRVSAIDHKILRRARIRWHHIARLCKEFYQTRECSLQYFKENLSHT